MSNISFFDRIKTIFEMIFSSPFFISLFVILVITLVILVFDSKINNKKLKYLIGSVYFVITVFVLIKYGSYVLSINDSIVEKFFSAMYFPNMVVYLSMLIISILVLVMTFVKKNSSFLMRIVNVSSFCFIWLLFVLVLDAVKRFKINVYEITEIYSNESLMILLQCSMCVFAIWIGAIIMDLLVRKIALKLDDNSNRVYALHEDIDSDYEDIRDYSDEEFQFGYLNQKRKDKEEEYLEILRQRGIDL